MATLFRETIRSLSADEPRRSLYGIAAGGVLITCWGTWLFTAEIPVYEVSQRARLELIERVSSVSSTVAGRVVEVRAELGRTVDVGAVLVQLDAQELVDRLAEIEARARQTTARHDALRRQIDIQEGALDAFRAAAQARMPEDEARSRAAEVAARAEEDEVARFETLRASGNVTQLELVQRQARAGVARADAEAARLGVARLRHDLDVQEQDREAEIEELRVELRTLEGELDVAAAAATIVRRERDDRSLRASEAGVVAERPGVALGSVVAAGQQVLTIAHPGPIHVTAHFDAAEALGRLHAGQRAWLELPGFPWSEYGHLEACVRHVGTEARAGSIEAELEIVDASASRIPVQHGLETEVRVEVERVTPATMLLRALGKFVEREPPREPDELEGGAR